MDEKITGLLQKEFEDLGTLNKLLIYMLYHLVTKKIRRKPYQAKMNKNRVGC
jgi:hypothetical protein